MARNSWKFYNSMKRIIEISAAKNYNGLDPKRKLSLKKIYYLFFLFDLIKKYI